MPGGKRKRLRSRLGGGGKAPSVAATQQSKTNPFEARENKRRKHAVAVETRKSTLLVEYQNTGKSNKFVDRRFGEGVPEISNEEKMLRRFQRQRERELKRASKFALGDDDEQGDEDLALTHGGRQITEDFDFGPATRAPQPEVEAGELDAALVAAANFGGGDGSGEEDPKRHRTHKEIMQEVIAKSKYYKALRQAEAQKTEEDIERLDENMDEISRLLQFREQKPKGVEAELRAALQRAQDRTREENKGSGQGAAVQGGGGGGGGAAGQGAADGGALGTEAHSKYGDFGSVMRDLAKEQRARASERSMKPEEVAAAAKKRLEELEKKRQLRMEGKETGSSGEEEEEEEEESEEESGEESEEEGESESESEAASGSEQSKEGEGEEAARRGRRSRKKGHAAKGADPERGEEEMPYVIECPSSFEALSDLVAQWGSRLRTLLDRILTCTSVHLAAENRGKLEKLLELLLRYLAAMGALQPYDVDMGDAVATACFRIAHELPGPAVACFRRALERMSQRRSRAMAKAARLATEKGSALDERALRCAVWPTAGELLQLQLAARVFPTSDKRHPVATPVQLFLGKTPMRCVRDVASAVMCAVILLRCAEPAKRFTPEVVGFTQSLLCHLFPSRAAVAAARQRRSAPGSGAEAESPSSLSPEEAVREGCLLPCAGTHPLAWLSLERAAEGGKRKKAQDVPEDAPLEVFSMPFSWCQAQSRAEEGVGGDQGEPPSRDQALAQEEAAESRVQKQGLTRLRVLRAAYQLIERSTQQLGGPGACPALPEALAPLVEVLPRTLPTSLPASLRGRHVECAAALQQARKSVREAREPLRWQVAEVLPLKSMTPKFDINYAPGKDMDPDRQRSEHKKLQRAVAQEKRGAMRSLRRDAAFLATAKQKEDEEARTEQKEDQRRVQRFLEGQQHEFKQLQREGKAKGGGMKKHLF